jgi:hypothetical protein
MTRDDLNNLLKSMDRNHTDKVEVYPLCKGSLISFVVNQKEGADVLLVEKS